MHNYSKDYGNKKTDETIADEVIEEVAEAETEEVVDEVAEVETAEETIEEPKSGTVVGCKNLNIRERPIATNDLNVICTIAEGTKVVIIDDESIVDWYKVCLENGVEGYCMKKYINLAS